uniref:UspA domain-containing protein n=1 Tax=Tetraselmis sp. GSL018 TaxID=582737 RepID=A0A061S7V1_9CHLO
MLATRHISSLRNGFLNKQASLSSRCRFVRPPRVSAARYVLRGDRKRLICQSSATEGNSAEAEPGRLSCNHVMVTVFDVADHLAEGSMQALNTAADLASKDTSKVTVVVVGSKDGSNENGMSQRIAGINEFLINRGCSNFEVLEKLSSENHSALIGDVADDIDADMVVMSTYSVHEHSVDANLLAEFVPCPMLMLP